LKPTLLPVGRILRIPPIRRDSGVFQTYRFANQETVAGICSRFGLDRRQFRQLNPDFVSETVHPGTAVNLPRPRPAALRRDWITRLGRPVRGSISSRYGWRWGRMHHGLDLAAPRGTPVWAVADGRVAFAGWRGSYGFFIQLQHLEMISGYGHLSRILVKPGQWVRRGQTIGRVGSSGRAYGNHLHFELEQQGRKVNPQKFLTL
jgi:murein DD-endopeptidase MepM/ murein hydrolase activator NlpD